MTDWQPGDLALCVRGEVWDVAARPPLDGWPKAGKIYRVGRVGMYRFSAGRFFALWPQDGPRNGNGMAVWDASRFRKIRPHAPDAEDAETIALLTGKPAQVPA